jgi:flagellar protein FliO/FliZ
METALLSMVTTLIAFVVVLALAYVTLRLLRGPLLARGGKAVGDGDAIHFVRALPVGPKERVVLVDYRGERCMLGVTSGGISLLKSWPLGEVASQAAQALDASRAPGAST